MDAQPAIRTREHYAIQFKEIKLRPPPQGIPFGVAVSALGSTTGIRAGYEFESPWEQAAVKACRALELRCWRAVEVANVVGTEMLPQWR